MCKIPGTGRSLSQQTISFSRCLLHADKLKGLTMLYLLSSGITPAQFILTLTVTVMITAIIFVKEKKHDPERA
jgi:hypothetical protein